MSNSLLKTKQEIILTKCCANNSFQTIKHCNWPIESRYCRAPISFLRDFFTKIHFRSVKKYSQPDKRQTVTEATWSWKHYSKQIFNWRVDIQKGVTHNFSKIVFLKKQILEVNANTIAQTIFFFQSEIFLFSIWKSKICISRCRNGNVSAPPCKISEMWVTPFWMSTLQL